MSDEPALLAQQEPAQLAGERARDAAGHRRPQHLVQLAALVVADEAHRRDAVVEQRREVVLDRAERLHRRADALDRGPDLVELGDVVAAELARQEDVRQRHAGRETADHERGRLDGRLGQPGQAHAGEHARARDVELEHRVRRPPGIAEPAVDAAVPAGRRGLAEVGEPQLRHVGQHRDVRRDHHGGLAGAVRALERRDVAIEQVALVEHALPVDEHERGDACACHQSVSCSSGASSASISGSLSGSLSTSSTSPDATSLASASAGADKPRTGSANRSRAGRSRSASPS